VVKIGPVVFENRDKQLYKVKIVLQLGRNLTIVAHLARWRSETDYKIAILISEE